MGGIIAMQMMGCFDPAGCQIKNDLQWIDIIAPCVILCLTGFAYLWLQRWRFERRYGKDQ
ncbi:MAG: hypothetical protein EOO77_44540 [Oxalobacteraceae bacterium]|nr:MAG: hypothetical protein EOO77_44540 [Oxalobacteraceae bacterium]